MKYAAVISAQKDKRPAEFAKKVFMQAGLTDIRIVTSCHSNTAGRVMRIMTAAPTSARAGKGTYLDVIKANANHFKDSDYVFFCPSDTKTLTTETLHQLMSTQGDIIVPVINGNEDYPLLLSASAVRWLSVYNGRLCFDGALNILEELALGRKKCVQITHRSVRSSETKETERYKPVINWI